MFDNVLQYTSVVDKDSKLVMEVLPSVQFHIETSHFFCIANHWFLCEMRSNWLSTTQRRCSNVFIIDFEKVLEYWFYLEITERDLR